MDTPPLPPGFALEPSQGAAPPLPPGFALESPGASQGPSIGQALSGAANLVTGGEIGSVPPGVDQERFMTARKAISDTPLMRALDAGAMAGKYIKGKANDVAGYIAEKGGQYGYPKTGAAIGTALGTAAEYIPTDRFSTAATAVGMAPGEASAAEALYKAPTSAQRTLAQVLSVESGTNERHLASVIANPEIMSDSTRSTKEVGKSLNDVFEKIGQTISPEVRKEVTGSFLRPNETKVATLSNTAEEIYTKLKSDPASVTPAEAFIGRSAAATAMRNPGIADVKTLRMFQDAFDTHLENSGVPEVRKLSQEYFRASAKESLEKLLPQTKNKNPAVVRSIVMSHYGAKAADALSRGEFSEAAIAAGSGAIMSPWVQGKAIPFLAGKTSPLAERAAVIGAGHTPAALRALQMQREQDDGQ